MEASVCESTAFAPPDEETVSTITTCETADAKCLYIVDVTESLKNTGQYDIGGTYTTTGKNKQPDLWFHFTTSKCVNGSYLFNLFVIIRQPTAHYRIQVNQKMEFESLVTRTDPQEFCLTNGMEPFTFNSVLADDNKFIKTYCLTANEFSKIDHGSLYIPIKIEKFDDTLLDKNVLIAVKDGHNYEALYKNRSNGDFTLTSKTGKSHKIHKIFLHHCPVLEKSAFESRNDTLELDIDDDQLEILIKYLYTAEVETAITGDFTSAVEVGRMFEIKSLLSVVEHLMFARTNKNTALETLLFSERHGLKTLRENVIRYIGLNRTILETESWKRLSKEQPNLVKDVLHVIRS